MMLMIAVQSYSYLGTYFISYGEELVIFETVRREARILVYLYIQVLVYFVYLSTCTDTHIVHYVSYY